MMYFNFKTLGAVLILVISFFAISESYNLNFGRNNSTNSPEKSSTQTDTNQSQVENLESNQGRVKLCKAYIKSVKWTSVESKSTLSIMPTECGAESFATQDLAWEFWQEVVDQTPDNPVWDKVYGTDVYWSMYDQFICHYQYAKSQKTPWNLEPARPLVSKEKMFITACNPKI